MSKQNTDANDPKAVTKMMLKTLWSTTWRIFAPVSVFFAIGLALDLNASTKPWGMVIGTGLGIIVAIILVALQLKDIRSQAKKTVASAGGTK